MEDNLLKHIISSCRRSSCGQLTNELSLEMIQLKEKVDRFPSSSPFQNLEVVTTLGVGGFGRVELVRVCFKHLKIVFNRNVCLFYKLLLPHDYIVHNLEIFATLYLYTCITLLK